MTPARRFEPRFSKSLYDWSKNTLISMITKGIAKIKSFIAYGDDDWKDVAHDLEAKVFEALEQDPDFVDSCPSGRDDSEYVKALAEFVWNKALKADTQEVKDFLINGRRRLVNMKDFGGLDADARVRMLMDMGIV